MKRSELFREAVNAAGHSYSPYSGFRVGAALLTADGRVFKGCNVENASYSLTVCAERAAIFSALSDGCREFEAIAVAGSESGDFSVPCIPCGACLQVLSEFCDNDFPILLSDGEHRLSDFLPARFSAAGLKRTAENAQNECNGEINVKR